MSKSISPGGTVCQTLARGWLVSCRNAPDLRSVPVIADFRRSVVGSASVLKGEVKAQAQTLLDEGEAVPDVARKLGVLPDTLHKAIRAKRLYQPKKRI